jgi:hypothetical protein
MLRLLSLCILAAVVADESGITLPSAPDKSPPQPVDTMPATISQIAPEEWYVIESPERIRVLASPSGIVVIEESEGPLKLRGKFAGGSKVETRSYSQKWLYVVTAEQAGRCELLLVPGPLDQQVIRQTLTISGSGPRPPPPGPGPEPAPVPVQPPSGLQVMLLVDQSDPVSALAAVNSVPVLQWLDSNTTPTDGRPGWRRWDRSSLSDPDTLATESATWRKLWSDIGSGLASGPQLVIITGAKVTTRPIITQPQLLQDLQAAKEGKL